MKTTDFVLHRTGTGKTTAARLVSKLFGEVGLRNGENIVEMTGEECVRMKVGDFSSLVKDISDENGVLIIDDAHTMMDGCPMVAKAMLSIIARAAEVDRKKLTIILCGSNEGIAEKVYKVNSALSGRFREIAFEDFGDLELSKLIDSMIQESGWKMNEAHILAAAARRVGRGRSLDGFGNAWAVRAQMEKAYRAALLRGESMYVGALHCHIYSIRSLNILLCLVLSQASVSVGRLARPASNLADLPSFKSSG